DTRRSSQEGKASRGADRERQLPKAPGRTTDVHSALRAGEHRVGGGPGAVSKFFACLTAIYAVTEAKNLLGLARADALTRKPPFHPRVATVREIQKVNPRSVDTPRGVGGCSTSGCEASVNSRNSPVTRKASCSPISTAWSPTRSI